MVVFCCSLLPCSCTCRRPVFMYRLMYGRPCILDRERTRGGPRSWWAKTSSSFSSQPGGLTGIRVVRSGVSTDMNQGECRHPWRVEQYLYPVMESLGKVFINVSISIPHYLCLASVSGPYCLILNTIQHNPVEKVYISICWVPFLFNKRYRYRNIDKISSQVTTANKSIEITLITLIINNSVNIYHYIFHISSWDHIVSVSGPYCHCLGSILRPHCLDLEKISTPLVNTDGIQAHH